MSGSIRNDTYYYNIRNNLPCTDDVYGKKLRFFPCQLRSLVNSKSIRATLLENLFVDCTAAKELDKCTIKKSVYFCGFGKRIRRSQLT